MARRGAGAGAAGIFLLFIVGVAIVAVVNREARETRERGGAPTEPPADGRDGGPLPFQPVLLGEPKVEVNPF